MCVWAWPKVVMNTTAARQGSRRTARTHLKMDVIVQKCCMEEGSRGGGGGIKQGMLACRCKCKQKLRTHVK